MFRAAVVQGFDYLAIEPNVCITRMPGPGTLQAVGRQPRSRSVLRRRLEEVVPGVPECGCAWTGGTKQLNPILFGERGKGVNCIDPT